MSSIGELLSARKGQEPRLIVTFELNEARGEVVAVVVLPDGSLAVENVFELSVDWHYEGDGWKPDFETP